MCLYTLDRKPKVAEKDIVCYKALRYCISVGSHKTPYLDELVTIPGCLAAKSNDPLCEYEIMPYTREQRWMVKGEGVHAYCEMKNASKIAAIYPISGRVAECTIPSGTEYWEGMHGDIAARTMLIEKIID